MRVLLVLSQPPAPEGGAAGRCAVALIRGLQGAGHTVRVLAADAACAAGAALPADLEVELLPVATAAGRRGRWARWTRPRGHLGDGPFARRAVELAADADVVHLDETDAAAAAIDWPVPAVAHLHCLTLRDQTLMPPWRRGSREALQLWRGERAAIRRHDHLLANSDEVAAGLQRAGARDVAVAPLGLDPAAYEDHAPLDAPVAGLIGTASWPPTARAVRRLAERVWPRILDAEPGARLVIAGRGMRPEAFGATGLAAASWPGEVPSASAFLRGLGVLVYPVGHGSGTKVKVLEALALGLPVVTTAAGAEGIAANDGMLVAETDDALAEHAVRLLRDGEERLARGRAARVAFLAGHSPAAVAARLTPIYERVAGRTSVPV